MRVGLVVTLCGLLNVVGCGGSGSGGSGGSTQPVLQAPTANAGGPYTGTAGTAIAFHGAGSSDPQGEALTYAWNFGDSATGSGVSPTHIYTASGTYQVALQVTDTSGLTGSTTTAATIAGVNAGALTGVVMSGATPVVGAHVYLLAASTTGYGGPGISASSTNASVSLLSAAATGTSDAVGAYVTTNANGAFGMTGDYSCATGQQMYLYAQGGNEGQGTNTGIGMLAAVGACPSGSAPTVYAVVNGVSTVATAYAVAGFATDATHFGSSGTALATAGMANAFANMPNLETLGNGQALATTPAGNGTAPLTEIYTLADVLAGCVNSTGPSSGGCATLFTNAESEGSSGTPPTETATAAINMAHNPGTNVAALYALVGSNPYYKNQLNAAPNDWTVALYFTGGGTGNPSNIAIDGQGNAWMSNSGAYVTPDIAELANDGAPLSPSAGYTESGVVYLGSLAVDTNGNIWVLSEPQGLSEFTSSGSYAGGSTSQLISEVANLAIDGNNNVWASIASNATYQGELIEFQNGSEISPLNGYATGVLFASPIAIDTSNNVWVGINGALSTSLSKFSSSGTLLSGASGYEGGGLGTGTGPIQGIAGDHYGDVWAAVGGTPVGSLVKFSSSGTALSPSTGFTGGGLIADSSYGQASYSSAGIAVDGAGNVWVANYFNSATVSEFSNAGVPISPATGYRLAAFDEKGIAVDGSGNVWVAGSGSMTVEFIGAGVPVVTPLAVGVKNGTLGTRP